MKRTRRAFTLIELLVVVAIIALLISILLPALSRAKEQTKAAICKANLKEMGTALFMYLQDNGDWFPGDHVQENRNSYIVWTTRLKRYLGGQRGIFWCPSSDPAYRWDKRDGWTGRDLTGWFYEPGERPYAGQGFFTYGYNAYGVREFSSPHLGLGGHPDSAGGEYVHLRQVRLPHDMIAIGDSDADGSWDAFIYPNILPGSDMEDDVRNRNWPGKRHNRGANILFADSHVDFFRRDALIGEKDYIRIRWNNDHLPHEDLW